MLSIPRRACFLSYLRLTLRIHALCLSSDSRQTDRWWLQHCSRSLLYSLFPPFTSTIRATRGSYKFPVTTAHSQRVRYTLAGHHVGARDTVLGKCYQCFFSCLHLTLRTRTCCSIALGDADVSLARKYPKRTLYANAQVRTGEAKRCRDASDNSIGNASAAALRAFQGTGGRAVPMCHINIGPQ
jgi:hypothetical protein|eukprot:COSAG02_NODE_64_length_43111_cov_35.627709_41_plen_184_part_00